MMIYFTPISGRHAYLTKKISRCIKCLYAYMLLLLMIMPTFCMADPLEKFTLKNGLQVLIQPDHRAPIAIVMLWYHVGSADEPGGLSGISHALEHMMFKGTASMPAGKFSQTIASLGGQENAFTTQDYTVYFEKISNRALNKVLALEADRMQHLSLSAQEFSKEISVVREERRLRTDNNPQALLLERFMATAQLSPPYQHPTIGWMFDLEHLNVDALKTWYERFYTPQQATLIIVGDVQPTTVKTAVARAFNPISKQHAILRYPQAEPPALGPKRIDLSIPSQQPMLFLGYTVPSLTNATPSSDAYALEVLAALLDAGDNARLSKDLIRSQHLASTANAYYDLYTRYASQFMLFAIPAPQHSLAQVKQALLAEINTLKNQLTPETELTRIKTQLIAQKTFEKDSLFGQAMELGLLECVGVGSEVAAQYADHIRHVSPAQLMAVAQKYFCDNCLTEASLHPLPSNRTPS